MTTPRQVHLQPAYLLHQRDYRNTSRIADFITKDFGRVSSVVKGVRRSSSKIRGVLQPFAPLKVSWTGRGSLVTLTGVETDDVPRSLGRLGLLCGFYVNELLLRLLPGHDPIEQVFKDYGACLSGLIPGGESRSLRIFEKRLLGHLGYGLNLEMDVYSDEPVQPSEYYRFEPDVGPMCVQDRDEQTYSGATLLSLASESLQDPKELREAKVLLGRALDQHLAGTPLKSRDVLRAMGRALVQ